MHIKFENLKSTCNHNEIGHLTAGKLYEYKQTLVMDDDGEFVKSGKYVITDDNGDHLSIQSLTNCDWIGGAWIVVA